MKTAVRRALSVVVVATLASSAIIGGLGPVPSATGEAEGQVSLVTDAGQRALSVGYGPINTMGNLYDNEVPEPVIEDESNETRTNIIASLETQRQNNQILLDSYSNYLSDTEQPATLIGMNEYIRQLNNGSSEANARIQAKEAIADYYATKEIQRNRQWAVTVENLQTAAQKAENDSGITADGPGESFFYAEARVPTDDPTVDGISFKDLDNTRQITLVNGTTVDIPSPQITTHLNYGSSPFPYTGNIDPYKNFTYTSINEDNTDPSTEETIVIDSLKTKSTDSVSGARLFYRQDWDLQVRIERQQEKLDQRIDNVINETYAEYQQGEIDNEDLISPLQLTRSYSPDNDSQYGTFTLATLANMGKSVPSNLSNVRTMNITAGGVEYQGTLLSDGLPQSGEFEVGTTYNTSDIDGEQLIQQGNGSIYTIPDKTEFTVDSVVGTDGRELNQSTIGYSNPSYESTNISEYKETMDDLRELQAQINARQANLTTAGSGGGISLPGLGLGLPSGQRLLLIIGLAGGALILLTRN